MELDSRDVGLREVCAFKKQRFSGHARERIGEAVAQVEACGMTPFPNRRNARRAKESCSSEKGVGSHFNV
jgi:hypothetical protein